MSRNFLCFLFTILCSEFAHSQDNEYAVSRIPASLLKNANAVKRFESVSFEMVDIKEAILRKKYAITILNENADDLAGCTEYYDKLQEIRNIEGTLYDSHGVQLKKLRNKQVMDLSGSDGNDLANDNRTKYHNFYYKNYPYTVEYEVETRYHTTLFFPFWMPQNAEHLSIQQSNFTITVPANYNVRYKAYNYGKDPSESREKNKRSIAWQLANVPAMEYEYGSPEWYEVTPVVISGPTEFYIESYTGNMSSWKEFGKFVYALKSGKDVLPGTIKTRVHEIADTIINTRDKIAALYQFMQKNTHYISVQLGIGGWQPFDAAYVASNAYGDCKALTNYMYSLLKEAGIKSVYTLVKAGTNNSNIIDDFPSQQFNHVILSVPLPKQDTVWLECTSQTLPAGYLSAFTANRYALMVTEEGGQLVRTPKYDIHQNMADRQVAAILNENGDLLISSLTNYSGTKQDRYHHLLNDLTKDKLKEELQEEWDLPSYEIRELQYTETKNATPYITEELILNVPGYATVTGKRIFILPNIINRWKLQLSPDSSRKNELLIKTEFTEIDTTVIQLPGGYKTESIPPPFMIETEFGKISSLTKVENGKLFYFRKLEHYPGRFPASSYGSLVKFYDAIYRSDHSRVVLVKE